ncbi:MAG: hypothetical protein A3E84_04255 [Gammaproteobacteria bacterium RIFCSPHIGHO2_12_FULL_42_13]|nr:MAG: hypothetical protein A3E84_04255 [Gammaproteobacteria bacterium RIFCSPHIGHO2_12_FULL_42_13]
MLKLIKKKISAFVAIGLAASFLSTGLSAFSFFSSNKDLPSPQAVKYALNAYRWAIDHGEAVNRSILTIVDFTLPSDKKRLWVINLKNNRVLLHTYVAQGKGSGTLFATRFSNSAGSHASSPGIFTTGEVYEGEHGQSLRVNGLEPGINDNALNREIVIHPAEYVTEAFIKAKGYAGRSWGCFAVDPDLAGRLISMLKGGTVLFANAPSEKYDPHVNHSLSYEDAMHYRGIMGGFLTS